jgi:glycosyltransferase involved in cell wall biosynthesis
MKVLFLAHSYPRFATDPVGSFVLRLAVALRGQGIEVEVLAPSAPGLAGEEQFEDVPVHRFRYAPGGFENLAYTGTMRDQVRGSLAAKLWLGSFLAAQAAAAVRLRRRFEARLVHAHWWFPGGLVGTALKDWWGTPLVTTMHGSDVRVAQSSALARPLFQYVMSNSDSVTTVSRWLADETQGLVPSTRPLVAPMPIKPDLFYPPDTSRAANTLLFVGKLNRQKGIEYLLRALALMRHKPTVDVVVGVGSAPEDVRALAETQGVAGQLRWHPLLPQAELAERYRHATALVMPASDEGLGLVAAEALLCETPVVAFASGGLLDLIDHDQTGLLAPAGDAAALARAVDDLLDRPDRGAALGRAGRAAVLARFGAHAVAQRYATLYHELERHRAA